VAHARGRFARIAAAVAAAAVPFLPKCPLCVLPLAAAMGVALPHGPAVEAIAAGAVAGWLGVTLATARWWPVRLSAVAAALAILGGRWLDAGWLSAGGCALMLGIVYWTRLRPRACASGACEGDRVFARR
jgi:hypothetical protein